MAITTPTVPNVIVVRGDARYEEAVAAAAITPGHLIQYDTAGKVKVHAVAGGYGVPWFADHDALRGKTNADAYAMGDLVPSWIAEPGTDVLAWLKAGSNVAFGASLVSAGDGTLIEDNEVASGVTANQVIAVARQALDLSGSGAVATRIIVRCL